MTSSLQTGAKTYAAHTSKPTGPRWAERARKSNDPEEAVALGQLLAEGGEWMRRGQVEAAIERFQRARCVAPEDPAALLNLAVAQRRSGRAAEARALLNQALELASDWPEIFHNLGSLELGEGRLEEALEPLKRALDLAPDWPEPFHTLGLVHRRMQQLSEALQAFDEALRLRPDWIEARHNRAVTWQLAGLEDRALAEYESLATQGCGLWETHNNLAFLLLKRGDYRRGFRELDWRFQNGGEPAARVHRPQPLWRGQPLQGRTVLLCEEQGAGDMIQFIRLAAAVRDLGGRVRVECSTNLRRLFESNALLDGCVGPDEPCPEADFQLPLLSLPRVLGTRLEDIHGTRPYLEADPTADDELKSTLDPWLARFADRFKVGIVWTGSPLNGVNAARSCRPEDFVPLADDERIALFSLQYAPQEQTSLGDLPIHNLIDFLGDFAHTAAVLRRLDLVITVDTSMAHLAGATGAEAWVLLHRPGADWRWLEDREDSPWYPTLRLFHQPRAGQWAAGQGTMGQGTEGRWKDVMSEVAEALRQRLDSDPLWASFGVSAEGMSE